MISAKLMALLLIATSFTGCTGDNTFDMSDEEMEQYITYTAIYYIDEVGDDVFNYGVLEVTYKDEEGEIQSIIISKDQIPAYVAVADVPYNFVIDFDLIYHKYDNVDFSDRSYDFSLNVNYLVSLYPYYVEEIVIEETITPSTKEEAAAAVEMIANFDFHVTGMVGDY